MSDFPEGPRVTRELPVPPVPLPSWSNQVPDTPGTLKSQPLLIFQTSARMPTVIPAEVKRQQVRSARRRPRKRIIWPAAFIVGALALTLALVFAVPLSGGQQKTFTLAQGISNLIANGQFEGGGVAPHSNLPTNISTKCGGTDIWGTCAKAFLDNGTLGTGQMQRPILGAVISQPFANPEYQTWCSCIKPHSGIDLAGAYGSPIMAADTGEVIWTGWDWSGLGWAVKISHGDFIATIYGHMARYIVKVGQYVTKGQTIGYEGSTGASTGPHVHFMVLINNVWVNPQDYVQLP